MKDQSIIFNASIPNNYQRYLTSFLFEGFAEDMAKRIAIQETKDINVLELAAGTGVLTGHLINVLPENAHLSASDIEEDMLSVARRNIHSSMIDWSITDMTKIRYDTEKFSNVVCQFGLMLIADRAEAFREIYRVLNKGGQLLFNIWSCIDKNPVWDITGSVIESIIGINPIMQHPGPFSLGKEETIQLLKDTGFRNISVEIISLKGMIDSAADAAKGLMEGLPLASAIRKKDSSMLPIILIALEKQLNEKLGSRPLISPLQAIVFTSYK